MIEANDPPLLRPEPAYRHVLRINAAMLWLPLLAGSLAADRLLLATTPFAWLAPLAVGAITVLAVIVAPNRIYRRLGYRIDDRLLQAVRGWLVHVDTIVPFVRVQHIDVTRSLFDKLFGTASLIVHTAGTHNSIVRVDGLAPDTALAMRDTIRAHIRTDFA
ncbi:MAG: PH domain-containing protein [Sphingomicrobium sp.]